MQKEAIDTATNTFLKCLKAIPNDEKQAYLEALDQCPELVQLESCVSSFLRHNDNDSAGAARQFIRYWKNRSAWFGRHRAFLPMRLVNGALTESCTTLMRTGWVQLLPRDMQGRCVCYIDMTIPEKRFECSHEDRIACIFYAMQLLSDSEGASVHRQGFVLIIQYDEFYFASNSVLDNFDDVVQAMPVHIADLHIVAGNPTSADESHFFEQFVPKAFNLLLSFQDVGNPTLLDHHQHVHMDSDPYIVLQQLIGCGLRREHLPVKVGGKWTLSNHTAWFRAQIQKETLTGTSQEVFKQPQVCFPAASCTTGVPLSPAKKKRASEAWISRQTRRHRRCYEKSLMIRIKYLQEKNQRARYLSSRLQKCLEDAEKIVSLLESGQELPLPTPKIPSVLTMPLSLHPATVNHPARPLFKSSPIVPAGPAVTINTAHFPLLTDKWNPHHPAVLTQPLHLSHSQGGGGRAVPQRELPANRIVFSSPGLVILGPPLPTSFYAQTTGTHTETPFHLFPT